MAVDKRQYVSLLKNAPLFRSLADRDLASFVESLQLVKFQDGETVFEEGQAGEHFYVVVAGSLQIIKHHGMAGEELLAQRGKGEFIGEMSLLDRDGTRMGQRDRRRRFAVDRNHARPVRPVARPPPHDCL